ncbi:flagellin [Billgrantia azerbaijanica]|nr:flagellin [Halomonas azerbaijanica]
MAIKGQAQRQSTQSDLASTIERLSSGFRINAAKDDAAGQAVANRLEANLRAGDAVSQGVNDGISLVQTAEGGLDAINDLLQRSRQLAVQASSEALSDSDRASINSEFKQLRDEIDRISRATEIFGQHPLAPSSEGKTVPKQLGDTASLGDTLPVDGSWGSYSSGIVSTAFIPKGAENVTLEIDSLGLDDDIQLFARDGTHLVGTPLQGTDPDVVWASNAVHSPADADNLVLTEANGFLPGASYDDAQLLEGGGSFDLSGSATGSYNGMTFTYSGDGDRYESGGDYNDGTNGVERHERLNIDEAKEDLVLLVVGSGAFNAKATWDAMPEATEQLPPPPPPHSKPVEIVTSANYGDAMGKVTIEPTPADSVSLKIDETELDPAERAREALGELQAALNQVDDYRSQYGAVNNRFASVLETQAQQDLNTAEARSRILDADYAEQTARLAKAQVVMQAGDAVLAQANQNPQTVLTLLEQGS